MLSSLLAAQMLISAPVPAAAALAPELSPTSVATSVLLSNEMNKFNPDEDDLKSMMGGLSYGDTQKPRKEEKTETPKYAPKAPAFKAPSMPAFDAPKFDAPKVDMPKIEAPKFDAPAFKAPSMPAFDAPKFDAPKVDMPKFEAPKFDAPKFDAPKFDMPKFEAPKVRSGAPDNPRPRAAVLRRWARA